MLKFNLRSYICILIFTQVAFLALPALSAELIGQTMSGGNFTLELSSATKPSSPDGIWGLATVTYKAGKTTTPEVYTFPVQAPPVIKKIAFGLLAISEKNGGMNGSYNVTFLYPGDEGLTTIGGVESDLDNGKYIEINRISPKWINKSGETEMAYLIQSVSKNRSGFIGPDGNQALDNAMIFFAIPDLMNEIRKQDSLFSHSYTSQLSNEVNSSIANLIRRKFLGKSVSLCGDDQFDVFVCKLDKRVISVCSGNMNGAAVLEYRAGSDRKIELSLSKQIDSNYVANKEAESFENGGYKYTVKFGNGGDTSSGGVIVERKGTIVSSQKCQPEMIEPYLIPRK
ncbi:hypothetical protein [Paraburkholderia sp. 35.1]|uniref:hypothetical protein n=1 Tax=Paraburkholderia sp. 35.1 TaxID=2991058 RepID=UPI003D1B2D69